MVVIQEDVIKPKMKKSADKEEEKRIPVFTVLKNNSVLKNVFLVGIPPPGPSSSSSNLEEKKSPVADQQDLEEILVVGRHPDCNITLEHPSISRFHLRIHSVPSKQSLSVFDLSSVHGTWVCGKKIAPGVRVELSDGDILQLGASSRIYKLHWIPLSRAYDYDNPFLPTVEVSETVEEKETQQNDDGFSLQHDDQRQMEISDLLFADMNIMSQMKHLAPSAPPLPEDLESPFSYEEEAEAKLPYHHSKSAKLQPAWQQNEEGLSLLQDRGPADFDDLVDGLDLLFTDMNVNSGRTSFTTDPLVHEVIHSSLSTEEEAENKKNSCYLSKDAGLQPMWQFDGENSIPNSTLASGKSQQKSSESSRPQLNSGMSIWKRRGKYASVSIETSRAGESSKRTSAELEMKSQDHENLTINSVPLYTFVSKDGVKEVFTPDKENTPDPRNRPSSKFGQEDELKANCAGEDDELAFTPDKENITPNTLLLRSLKKLEKFEDNRNRKTYRSSSLKNATSEVYREMGELGSSNKRNHAEESLQENNARSPYKSQARLEAEVNVFKEKTNRIPFESLLASPNNTKPETSKLETSRCCKSFNTIHIKEGISSFRNTPKEEIKKWTMVVDAACLLNKESRKTLQLMQGLQGTNLMIPRIVIRELDCMKRRGNLFRKTTEVCSALEWIEDCMANAQWWIHVQSSMEDVRPIAPTPLASPSSLFSQEIEKTEKFSISSVPFSPCGSWLDIVSPTTEDHILECALLFRRIRSNGQLVLLSNDVTLKIKAMAEGLLCETAEGFRQSLVNPFSERFLWNDSSPRGPTWSCVDDAVLREKYYNGPIHKQSKSAEGAKGLKLILLHNSHFRQISCVR